MNQINSEILLKFIECVVLLVSLLVGRYLVPWIKSKTNTNNLGTLIGWAETFARAAEMIITTEKSGEEKLALVTVWLKNKADDLGVNLSEDDIRSLIEEAVYVLKNGK